MSVRRLLVSILLLASAAAGLAIAAPPARFSAMLDNGQRLEGDTLADWNATDAQPTLDGQPLLQSDNPLRWLRDRSLVPSSVPAPFVETISGDRIPGLPIGYRSGGASSYEPQPAHFVVVPLASLQPPIPEKEPQVAVVERFVRRLVWSSRGDDRYQSSTVFYRDGRSATFRAVRFGEKTITLLLADGPQTVPMSELAELHMPQRDVWEAYYDELAALSPDGQTRLLQIETTDGWRITTSLARMRFATRGDPDDFERWTHGLHPAWSLQTLWIPNSKIWIRRSFAPHEVPLSRVTPLQIRQTSPLTGSGRLWRLDRNVQGGPLRSGQHDFGWGWGVQAHCELHFQLPSQVRSFRSHVSLDRIAGRGGCVRARVFADSTDTDPLFESDFLIGANATVDTGRLTLTKSGEAAKRLILQIDAAATERPAGADPLDIRDFADWLDPLLLLDQRRLARELTLRGPRLIAAWNGWTISTSDPAAMSLVGFWDPLAPAPGSFAHGVVTRGGPITLTKQLQLTEKDQWLIVAVSRPIETDSKGMIEVRVDGQLVSEYEIPLSDRQNPDAAPLAVPLDDYRSSSGKPINLAIAQVGGGDTPAHWRTIRLTDQLPTLYQLLEDEGELVAAREDQTGQAKFITKDRHSGGASIEMTAGGSFRLLREGQEPIRVRQNPDWGEYRYLRFAFRKYGEGRICVELDHLHSPEHPARYDAGLGEPCFGQAVRVWVQRLPSEWIVMTRDLWAEFGQLDVSSLTLSVPDGQYALFDHVYLARSQVDFELIPKAPSVELTNQKARLELARPVLEKVLPCAVAIQYEDGRLSSGVMIDADGLALTAGHALIAPDRPVTVYLADGRKLAGKTRGVFRQLDLGLIKIDSPGPYPVVEIDPQSEIPTDLLYVGLTHRRALEAEGPAKPQTSVVGIRRVFRNMVWTDFDVEDFSAGGPLLDSDGKLIGVHNRRSRFGGFLYSRLGDLSEVLKRLKAGEVWGQWLSGTTPMIGVSVISGQRGCRVTALPAERGELASNIRVGDIIQRVEGHAIVSLEDIHALLTGKDAGSQIEVEILRGDDRVSAKLTLTPRVP